MMDLARPPRRLPAPAGRWPRRVAGIAAIAALASCDGNFLGDDPSTGLQFTVTRSPLQPVEVPGEPNSAPVEDAVLEVRKASGGPRVLTRTDAAGQALLLVDAGDYEIEVTGCPGAIGLPDTQAATVVEGARTTVSFDCDTGIR